MKDIDFLSRRWERKEIKLIDLIKAVENFKQPKDFTSYFISYSIIRDVVELSHLDPNQVRKFAIDKATLIECRKIVHTVKGQSEMPEFEQLKSQFDDQQHQSKLNP